MKINPLLCALLGSFFVFGAGAMLNAVNAEAAHSLDGYNVVWDSQSEKSPDSMPLGGGDIGLNVWVENNELLFYIGRSGTFDDGDDTRGG